MQVLTELFPFSILFRYKKIPYVVTRLSVRPSVWCPSFVEISLINGHTTSSWAIDLKFGMTVGKVIKCTSEKELGSKFKLQDVIDVI